MNTHKKYAGVLLLICMAVMILQGCSASNPDSANSSLEATPAATELPATPTTITTETSTPTAAPTATPTLPPPPTTVLVPKLYTIDLTKGGDVPADLKEYVFNYSGSAGGGGPCAGGKGVPAWSESYAGATIAAFPKTLQWIATDLSGNSTAQVNLKLPDGSLDSSEEGTGDSGCCWYRYEIVPGSLLGKYTIELVQGSTVLTDSVTLALPDNPTRIVYEGNEWFAGFEPNEQVTLWTYYAATLNEFLQPEIANFFPGLPDFPKFFEEWDLGRTTLNAFLSQQTVTADEYGTFQVGYTSEQLPLIDEWGEVNGYNGGSRITTVAEGEMSGLTSVNQLVGGCNGSLPSRLNIGDTARVTDYVDQNNSFTYYSKDYFPAGTPVTMVLGPICERSSREVSNGRWEWIVDMPGHTGLRVAESNAEGYYLEPVNP